MYSQGMLTNSPSPCAKKAIWHIKELKKHLENSRCQQGTNNQHDYSEGKKLNDNTRRFNSVHSEVPIKQTKLCTEGTDLCLQSNDENDKCKKVAGVLQKAMMLIERLESDRQKGMEALQKEKLKRQTLMKKQNNLFQWKQQHFAAAVQNEYEASNRDITELRRHLKVKKDEMQKMRNSLSHTERQNRQLVEEIDFLRKHSPLMKEKLQLERQMTKQLRSAQAEASEVFTQLSQELRGAQQELDKEELLHNKERGMFTNELQDARSQLKDELTNLQELKSDGDFHCTKILETKKKAALKQKQLDATLQQSFFLEAQEAKINDSIVELRAKKEGNMIKHLGIEHLKKQIQITRSENEAKLSEYEENFSMKFLELLHLRDENNKHDMEIKDYKGKIHQSKQTTEQLQRDREQILEKISQIEEKREQAEGNLSLWAAQHARTKASLGILKQQTFKQEQRNREEEDKHKIQLMCERNKVVALKDNISSHVEEYNLFKLDCKKKENELLKEYEAVSSAAAQLETKMVEQKKIHTEQTVELERKLSDTMTKRKNLSDELEEQRSACLKHLESEKKALSAVLVRREQASCRIEALRLGSKKYTKASDMMEQITTTMPHDIEELQSMHDMLDYKHKTVSVMMNSLQCDVKACRNRNRLSEETFSTLLAQRQAVMLDIEANLKKALKENGELAQEYIALQKALLIARQKVANTLHEKNEAEASLHDLKQLSLLQRRMHKDMLENFEHRSVYSQAELAHCQALSNENNQKMKALQEQCSGAIDHISAFLQTLPDDSTTSHDAAADKQKPMDNDGLNKAKPTAE
ncbi:coiled-coil domain-containing protein 178 isoform X3 [Salminus brasiliensis]|uniref:coiled-coil domain-containing protein 178 isoform X3 n=1 Tax=Salminus brasiliensis TaxID=930266 RepID=UPI003B83884C